MEQSLDLGVVGNCAWGGLVDATRRGSSGPACRASTRTRSSPPSSTSARTATGASPSSSRDLASSEQRYDGNTPILVTTLRDRAGAEVEVRDFAPRFEQYGRIFRPTMLVRRVRPLRGDPRVRIVLRPRCELRRAAARA